MLRRTRFIQVLTVLALACAGFVQVAQAQQARTLKNKAVTVRFCPGTCAAVNGHPYKPGGKATVYETRRGWARVSGYLDRAKLVKSFGDKITEKPALWLPVSALVTQTSAKKAKRSKPVIKKQVAKKKQKKSVRVASNRRKVTLPQYRPNSTFQAPATVQTTEIVDPQPVVQPEVIAEPVEIAKPVEVVESKPVQTEVETTAVKGATQALTWEQLQEKLAQQKTNLATKAATPSVIPTVSSDVQKEDASAKDEQVRKDEQARKVEQAREARLASEAARKAAADRAVANAKAATEAAAEAKQAKDIAEKAKVEKANAAARAAIAEKAKQAAMEAEEKRLADVAEANRKAREIAEANEKKEAQTAKKADTQVAVILPPVVKQDASQQSPETTAAQSAEPVFKSADVAPISFGDRPKKLTKALLDKRLSKLPGRKSKVRKDVVIALRHYALGLLKSGECDGIAKGGPATTKGMLFVACTDDPSYQRIFPLQEQSW